MIKHFLDKYLPTPESIRRRKSLRIFGKLLHNPELWLFTHRSVSLAVAIGIFSGWLPLLGHMLVAAALAILLRANLPLSILLVWYSNPLTMPFLFYAGYKVGIFVLQIPADALPELSVNTLFSSFSGIWKPLWVGCTLLGLLGGGVGGLCVRLFWRSKVPVRSDRR